MVIPVSGEPIAMFLAWMGEARETGVSLPECVALATVNAETQPSVRMVLLKDCDANGFVFYTNLNSRKAADLAENPRAALCFHWRELGRQVRVEGRVEPVDDAEADAYFASRPRESQLGAWASDQSAELTHRDELLRRFQETEQRYANRDVPRPPFWSGYRLKPARIEFWQEMPHRLHERVLYIRAENGNWVLRRLYP